MYWILKESGNLVCRVTLKKFGVIVIAAMYEKLAVYLILSGSSF